MMSFSLHWKQMLSMVTEFIERTLTLLPGLNVAKMSLFMVKQ